ncbi:chromosome partitioning protein ParA [Atopomonas sediminilitoris]|uniref:chromosome partitioning protein ParA n=1 Tax=Atopomonas sediminilitoris TaxID=2919919 RepID=UPI001F4DB2A4|nr:chromosome partitioning protein ParA [Atopomonas sediminilitoris]MCJ8167737.1 chromosome partitioning protein ParA [Atopomonas sediminilitoris]
MQKKPHMVEAVLFFNERGVSKEMLYPEFEALLDGVVNLPEFADREMCAAYVLINPRLLVRAVVTFLIDFDEKGGADKGWNIPLRHLAESAGRGPDLGAGPIRLGCKSQCPVSWHQMHLWDPSLSPQKNDLALIRDAVKRNHLGLLVEEEVPPVFTPDNLQMAAEDQWRAGQADSEQLKAQAEQMEQEYRQKSAQMIKQQRLQLTSLKQKYEEEIARYKLAQGELQKGLQHELADLQQALQQQESLNASLKKKLHEQADQSQRVREQMTQQLRDLQDSGQSEAGVLRAQFEQELAIKIAAAVADVQEQVAIRDVELAYRHEQEGKLQQELQQLQKRCDELSAGGPGQLLKRLTDMGVVFVAYHPGAGHLTISLADMPRYQENPMAFAAAKCFVNEGVYRQWLAHYQSPACDTRLPGGERCGITLDRVDQPSRYVPGQSNCCSRHRSLEQPLRTVG